MSSPLLLAIDAVPPHTPSSAEPRERAPRERSGLIRGAETETLPHGPTDPLFVAAGSDSGLLRIGLAPGRALNAFAISGNRMFNISQRVIGETAAILYRARVLARRASPRAPVLSAWQRPRKEGRR
jgi:hypothetical protein